MGRVGYLWCVHGSSGGYTVGRECLFDPYSSPGGFGGGGKGVVRLQLGYDRGKSRKSMLTHASIKAR